MGVMIHVIGDAINNLGVMAAGLVIWLAAPHTGESGRRIVGILEHNPTENPSDYSNQGIDHMYPTARAI
ncbi:hypothetical protein N7537_003317 [Penicillium hordei]|uniref:Uncharacterized protein n=1 Tax=Penicillium hordei TaxID=40994 RepID=A0AAD6MPN0_9EURO|nr:uncharacterized protein N7537_003317 [Penicillium hordei]KAJ5618203.1 hypothetical protein N7537_003317 [Penicillium hordei]